MNKHEIELGDEVQDTVTGLKGVAVCRCDWIYGCVRWVIQPPMGKDGKIPESGSFDAEALKVLKKAKVKRSEKSAETGGPVPVPAQHSTPLR